MTFSKPSAILSIMTILLSINGCKRQAEQGQVIAEVGDAKLTLPQLLEEFPDQIKDQLSSAEIREFVLMWINDQVLYQEALALKMDEAPELQREFDKLRRELVINKLLETTLDNGITVTDEEITAYYEANKESFVLSDDIVKANHLLFDTQKEANDARKRLQDGESFADIAATSSGDSLHQPDWELGYFTRNDVIPEIANIVFRMSVNSYSYPIKSEFGYHIVQLVDKQEKGEVKRLENIKDEIRQKIITKKRQDKYQRFLLQMKSKFKIKTNFKLIDSSIMDSLMYDESEE